MRALISILRAITSPNYIAGPPFDPVALRVLD
jgi:hypothetical protein